MSKKITTEQYVNACKQRYGDMFDYSNVTYVNAKTKTNFKCNICGLTNYQTCDNHLRHGGCKGCGGKSTSKKLAMSEEEFIQKAKSVHGDKYDYTDCGYTALTNKIKIYCKSCCKYFMQAAGLHWCKRGCPDCANISRKTKKCITKDMWLEKSLEIHGDKFDYSETEYTSLYDNVKIRCRKHNIVFEEFAYRHYYGNVGCGKCHKHISKVSKAENAWINSLGVSVERSYYLKINGKKYTTDGYDVDTGTAYEFMGSYYHGDTRLFEPDGYNFLLKKTFGELYERTMRKIEDLKTVCANVVVMWEYDWNVQNNIKNISQLRNKKGTV